MFLFIGQKILAQPRGLAYCIINCPYPHMFRYSGTKTGHPQRTHETLLPSLSDSEEYISEGEGEVIINHEVTNDGKYNIH